MGLVAEQRGKYLCLRGVLPPKPDSGKSRSFTQRISLRVGPNAAGLRYAEGVAREISASLLQGSFSWDDWRRGGGPAEGAIVSEWIPAYKAHLMATENYQRAANPERKWVNEQWHCGLSGLLQDEPVTLENCLFSLNRSKQRKQPRSRARQLTAQNLSRFAKFCGVAIDLAEEGRGYSQAEIERYVPSESEVLDCWDLLPKDSPWRVFYALSSVYGLRPHEVFSGHLEPLEIEGQAPVLCFYVHEQDRAGKIQTKTGARPVVPLPETWINIFGIEPEMVDRLPKISADYSSYGTIASATYRKHGIPFTPYGTRHRWSLYANTDGELGTLTAAKFLGHSVMTNQRTYQRHMDLVRAMARYTAQRQDSSTSGSQF
jgi:integrase